MCEFYTDFFFFYFQMTLPYPLNKPNFFSVSLTVSLIDWYSCLLITVFILNILRNTKIIRSLYSFFFSFSVDSFFFSLCFSSLFAFTFSSFLSVLIFLYFFNSFFSLPFFLSFVSHLPILHFLLCIPSFTQITLTNDVDMHLRPRT